MRVLLYTKPYFLDEVLSAAPELARRCELHIVVEIPPEGWGANILPPKPSDARDGLVDLWSVLGDAVPPEAQRAMMNVASASAAIFSERHTVSLRAVLSSLCLGRAISRLEPDVIHLNGDSLRFAYTAPLLRRLPLIVSQHDVVNHAGEQGWRSRMALPRRILAPWMTELVLHNTKTTAGPIVDAALSRGVRVTSVLLGPYLAYRGLAHGDDEDTHRESGTFLFIGRLSPYKGIDHFVAAAELVAREIPHVRFVIAGAPIDGFVAPAPRTLESGCSLDVYAHHLSNEQLVALIRESRVVVLPYVDASQSGVVLTAYALNRSVITTDVGGLSDYVVNGVTGEVVAVTSESELSRAMLRICRMPSLLAEREKGVAAFVSRELSWAGFAEQLTAAYERAISYRDCGV